MNNLFNKEVTQPSDTITTVKISVLKLLALVEQHDKTTMKDVIDKVVAETGVKISVANGLVPMIVHEWANAGNGTVELGRNGGVFPGGKLQRIDARQRCETCNQVVRFNKKEE